MNLCKLLTKNFFILQFNSSKKSKGGNKVKKCVSVLTVLMLVLSLVAGIGVPSAKAFEPVSPISHIKDYLSQNVKGPAIPSDIKQKAESLKLPTELIDGVEIPKNLVEAKKIKSGEDYVKVMIDGTKNPALVFAKENNISINSSTLSEVERSTVVNYINQVKAEHDSLKQSLAGLPVTFKSDLYIAYNGVIVETQIKNIKDLYTRFGKERVHIEQIYTINDDYSNQLVGATQAWTDPGVDGTGMYVGVVDTGVDYNHPDLGGGFGPDYKVVAGWDFGDDDTDPMDCNGHGTHVSGIMAADGQVKGVAPKAKIVIAKIVPGCEGSASSLDIADAFDYMADPMNLDEGDEGAHPPVAAVNMSFGSEAGFVTTNEPEQAAVEACVNAGIFVSLSAGNSYWSYYPYGYYPFFPDFSLVGAPSVTPSAISVAASYNSCGRYTALTKIAPEPTANYAYIVGSASPDPIATLGDNSGAGYPYVYCGYGSPEEIPDSVNGKIALMSRGAGISFYIKVNNAYAKGAIGAIIYNNTSGYISMDTTGQANIPAVSISQADGLALKAYAEISGDGTGRVGFKPNTYADVPQAGDTMVDFSSWGPPPDLSFKPEITAPGGGIWSTVPIAQGSYDNYSGTSMAAPHVGAVGALVKQAHPDWSPEQIKIALMNTAKILTSGSLPYSVLKQGAGRVDVYNALHTDVLVTDASKGTAYVALGELPSYKTSPVVFTVRLTNTGSSPVTYNISWTGPQTVNFNLAPKALTGATVSTIPSGSVTVPAGGTADVVVMVDATAVADWTGFNYLEGFVKFTPTSGTELHIPYMGVLGNWNEFVNEDDWDFNPLIDPPADDPMNFTQYLYDVGATWPELTDGSDWYYAGVDFDGYLDRDAIAFNPSYYLLEADFWALRNMQNVTIEIRDISNNLIKTIDSMDYAYKMIPGYDIDWYYYDIYDYDWWVWDGTDSLDNPVPDGKYKLVIKATPPKIFNKLTYDAPQVIEFPVSLDTVEPSVTITSINDNGNGTYTINWDPATDSAPSSGIWGYEVDWYDSEGNLIDYDLVSPDSTSYTIEGLPKGDYLFVVWAIDNANNADYNLAPYSIYEITSSVNNPSWGTITPSGAVLAGQGSNKSFVITPNTGYHISDVLVDGASVLTPELRKYVVESTSYTYTFTNVQADHTIQAVFAPGILNYIITASAGTGGTISPSGDVLVPQFGSQTFTITPDTNYHIYDVLVDGVSVGAVSTYTFENVSDNHTIEAYFQHNYFKTTYPVGTEVFSPTDTIHVTWDVEGFTSTEGKVRVLFYNGSSWQLVASDLDLADGSYDIDLSTKTIVDPLRCRVRAGIYDPTTGAWLTWTNGQYYDESGHFWIVDTSPTQYFKTTYPVGTEVFSPTDTITVSWDVEGFTGTEGKIRVLFYNGSSWQLVASDLNLADGSYDIDLSTKTIVDPLRCRVRAGIYDPTTGAWLTWTDGTHTGQYYDESGHFWVKDSIPIF